MKKAAFLDRDGVINYDSPNYIKDWDEFKFIPKSIKAINILCENNFKVILITNQSVINRKMVTKKKLNIIFNNMKKAIKKRG